MTLSAAAAAGVQSRVAGRQHHRVSQVTPRKCQHGVPLLVDNFPSDLGPQIQIADEGDSVQTQRQQEKSQEDDTAAPTPALLVARARSCSGHHFVQEILRGRTIACHYRTERESDALYLDIIVSFVSRGPRLFINVQAHRYSSSGSVQTLSSICNKNGDPPTSSVIGRAQLRTQTIRARGWGLDVADAVVERHLQDKMSSCN